MSNTLEQIALRQAEFDRNHSGRTEFFEPITDKNIEALEHLIVCLTGEVGELANLAKKIRRGDHTLTDKFPEVTEEIADIFIYTIKMSNQLGFDLQKAYDKKMAQNSIRFGKYRK